MKRIDDHEVFVEVERHIDRKPRLLTEQELDEAIILAAGKRYLHQRHRTLKTLFQEQLQAITDLHNKQINEAIHGFHEFVMEADIIRPEADQAFNYGRLHRAIDTYIAERNRLKESSNDKERLHYRDIVTK